jgi:hypothetical protein
MTRRPEAAVRLSALLCLALAAPPAASQTASASRERQAEIYRQLLAAPDDPDLTEAYLEASRALQDDEAIISTLERVLILHPGDPEATAELGAAYFRLGSYAAAEHHLSAARDLLPPGPERRRVEAFLSEISTRSARSQFEGFLTAGVVMSSNANLGVADRTLRVGGADVLFDQSLEAESGAGFRTTATVTHRYDLGGPNADAWLTDAGFYSQRFFDEDAGDVDALSVATGPSLALTDEAYGPTARPFLSFDAAWSAHSPLFRQSGGGVEATAPYGQRTTLFGLVEGGWRDYSGADRRGYDAGLVDGEAGFAYAPAPGVVLSAALAGRTERAREDRYASNLIGVRVAGLVDYDAGFDETWRLSAFANLSGRFFDEADEDVDPDRTREDALLRLGAANLFRLGDGVGIQIDAEWLVQESNIANYDLRSVTGALSLVYEF